MVSKPKRPCGKPGCRELTITRYCEAHAKAERQAVDRQRGTASQRGYNARWAKARAAYLARYPLCVHCEREGRLTGATELDHIISHRGDTDLFWDFTSNIQPLCKSCHSRKTATEDSSFAGWNRKQH